jgi:4-amino-4-deoxychorismate lyase
LVESIKVKNGNLLNLSNHNERLQSSLYGVFGLKSNIKLEEIITIPDTAKSGIFKCRVIYDDKITHVEFLPYTIKPVRSLRLIEDNKVSYPYKYANRENIDRLMEMRGNCDDILIIKRGMVTDSSYANVVFRELNGNWVTPDTCLLAGTRRANLIKSGHIKEVSIHINDIYKFTELKLINAMLGLDDTFGIPIENIELCLEPRA